VVLGGSTEDMVEQYPFLFRCFTVIIGGGGGVVSMPMVWRERGYYRSAWSFTNISVSQSILLHFTVHQLSENDS
jgi:hypothetical protein